MKMLLRTLWPLDENREIVVDHFPFIIGRRNDNDCSLPLAFVSRRHCMLTWEDSQVLVQDLESYNGTFVNGKAATCPLPVRPGDELTLGPCSFRVLMLNGDQNAPALHSSGTAEARTMRSPDLKDDSTFRGAKPSTSQPAAGGSKF